MSAQPLSVPELLGRDQFEVDEDEPHIVVDARICATCVDKPCVAVCPAQLYTLGADGELTFDHAGCLECGTCRIVGSDTVVARWRYPGPTMGVEYRYG